MLGFLPVIPEYSELYKLYIQDRLSCRQIADEFHVTPTTVSHWLRRRGIKARPKSSSHYFRIIDGRKHKRCRGPLHKDGRWLPLENFIYPNGKIRSQCKACDSHYKGSESLVPLTNFYLAQFQFCINCLGIMEASRRIEISQSALWSIRRNKVRKIKAKTARKVLLLVKTLNDTGEVRHRLSIRHGAKARGRKERIPTARNDFYKRSGDLDTEQHRILRRKHAA